jgi:hypothetical protein
MPCKDTTCTAPSPYAWHLALRLFLSLVAQVKPLFTVEMEFDCTQHEGHAIRQRVRASTNAVTESSRLVATTGRLTYACKMLPPSEITACRTVCVKRFLDKTLHLRQTRLPSLLSSHMIVESPSISAVSQIVPNNTAEQCRTKSGHRYPCCRSHQMLGPGLGRTTSTHSYSILPSHRNCR